MSASSSLSIGKVTVPAVNSACISLTRWRAFRMVSPPTLKCVCEAVSRPVGDPVFPSGLWKESGLAQILSSPQSTQRVTECHGSCSSRPNVTRPLLYLEDAPVNPAQTHGQNPGLGDSKGEPCEKLLWPRKPPDSLQCLTWSHFMCLTGFPFTNKIRV